MLRVGQNHIYMVYIYGVYLYGVFGREITRYTVIYGAYVRFWTTQCMLLCCPHPKLRKLISGVRISCTHCPPTLHTLPTYVAHTALLHCTHCPPTLHALPSYTARTALLHCTHCPPTLHTLPSYTAHTALLHCTHCPPTLHTLASYTAHTGLLRCTHCPPTLLAERKRYRVGHNWDFAANLL